MDSADRAAHQNRNIFETWSVRLARENSGWGYTKIRDVMFTLDHKISRTTVRRILAEDGIESAPERRKHMLWATFLKAHWGAIAAMDFFKVEVMN